MREITEVLESLHKRYRFDVLYSHQETGNLVTYRRDLLAVGGKASGVRWQEFNASSVLPGALRIRRSSSGKQTRRQNSLPIPLKTQATGKASLGDTLALVDLVKRFPKLEGSKPSPGLQRSVEKEAWQTIESFLHDCGHGCREELLPNLLTNGRAFSSPSLGNHGERRFFRVDSDYQTQGRENRGGWLRSLCLSIEVVLA